MGLKTRGNEIGSAFLNGPGNWRAWTIREKPLPNEQNSRFKPDNRPSLMRVSRLTASIEVELLNTHAGAIGE